MFLHPAVEARSHAETDDVSSSWCSAKHFHAGAQGSVQQEAMMGGRGRGKAQVGELVECVGVFIM